MLTEAHRRWTVPVLDRPQTRSRTNGIQRRHIWTAVGIVWGLEWVSKGLALEAGDWTSPGLANEDETGIPQFIKAESGVKIQELIQGKGKKAKKGDRVEINYVLRRSNGYFIYSTVEGVSFQPRDIPTGPIDVTIGDPEMIQGISDALERMNEGGRLRALIPAALGYRDNPSLLPQPPNFAGKRQIINHANEALLFELELLKIRS